MNNASFFSFVGSFFGTVALCYYFFIPLHGETLFNEKLFFVISGATLLLLLIIQIVRKGLRGWLASLFVGACMALTFISWFEHTHQAPNPPTGSQVSFRGVVTSIRSSYPGQAVRMRICWSNSCTKHSSYLVEIKHYTQQLLTVGDIATISGTTAKVEAFETENGAIFDYPRYLWKDAVSYRVNAKVVETGGVTRSPTLYLKRILWKAHVGLVQSVKQIVSWTASPILSGVLIGDGTLIRDETNEQFRKLGLSHILVLSGFNMTLVASVMYMIFRRTSTSIRSIATIVSLILFLILAGIAPPATRAVVMVSLFLIIKNTGRVGNESRILLLAALLMTLWNPRILLYDVSFQLSFLATGGLLYISPLITRILPAKLPLRGIFSETVGAQIAVMPLILSLSGIFSPYSIPLNLIIVPIVPIIMLSGAAGIVLWWIMPTLGTIASYPADVLIRAMLWLAEKVEMLPGSIIALGIPSSATVLISYIVLASMIWYLTYTFPMPDKDEGNGTLFA